MYFKNKIAIKVKDNIQQILRIHSFHLLSWLPASLTVCLLIVTVTVRITDTRLSVTVGYVQTYDSISINLIKSECTAASYYSTTIFTVTTNNSRNKKLQ